MTQRLEILRSVVPLPLDVVDLVCVATAELVSVEPNVLAPVPVAHENCGSNLGFPVRGKLIAAVGA